MASLSEQFRGRKLPTQVVQLPANADEYQRLSRALNAELWTLEEARSRGAMDVRAERAAVDRVQAALDAEHIVEVHLSAIPPPVWEDLVAQCPPNAEDLARGYQWDVATLRPRLLTLAVTDDDPPDWDKLAKEGEITAGELSAIFDAAVMLNMRGLSIAVGKER